MTLKSLQCIHSAVVYSILCYWASSSSVMSLSISTSWKVLPCNWTVQRATGSSWKWDVTCLVVHIRICSFIACWAHEGLILNPVPSCKTLYSWRLAFYTRCRYPTFVSEGCAVPTNHVRCSTTLMDMQLLWYSCQGFRWQRKQTLLSGCHLRTPWQPHYNCYLYPPGQGIQPLPSTHLHITCYVMLMQYHHHNHLEAQCIFMYSYGNYCLLPKQPIATPQYA